MIALAGWGVRPPAAVAQTRTKFVPTFSTSPRVRQQVDRLGRLAAQKLWDEWLNLYQQLVDDPRDLVLEKDQEVLIGVRHHCHQLLAALPLAVQQRYRALNNEKARKLYEQAAGRRDSVQMREIISRFRHTSSATSALVWLADNALDEGKPDLARVAYARLARDPVVSPQMLLRYAMAAAGSGHARESQAALERARRDFGKQRIRLQGEDRSVEEAAGLVAAALAADALPAEAWPRFGGATGDRMMPRGPAGPLRLRWSYELPPAPETAIRSFSRGQVLIGSSRSRFTFLTFPAAALGRVFVQGPRNLAALDPETGRPTWDRQDFTISPEEIETPQVDVRRGGSYYRSRTGIQAAPEVAGNRVVSRMALISSDRDNPRWPAEFALASVDARSGSVIWQRLGEGSQPRGSWYNLPTLTANSVLSGTATLKGGITEFSAVALDEATGEPLWTTYLGAGSDPLNNVDGSPPVIRDGLVWIESSLYTLSALDLITGDVRMIYRYDPSYQRSTRGGFDSSPAVANEPISLLPTPAGPIVFSPRWGVEVAAFNPATGALLWTAQKSNRTTVGSLFGADAERVYLCGEHVEAINLEDGAREWSWEPRQAAPSQMGFAALCGDRIYFPVEGKIQALRAADGSELEVLDTLAALGESPGYTSLLVLPDLMLVATKDRLIALEQAK